MQDTRKTPDDPEKRLWSAGVLVRYWLLQLPEFALVIVVLLLLQSWLEYPSWLVWTLAGLWLAKDAALYPLVWRSYDPAYPAKRHALDGEHGVAAERLERTGYVLLRGELWHAELDHGARPVEKGETVRVRATRRLTVIVVAVDE